MKAFGGALDISPLSTTLGFLFVAVVLVRFADAKSDKVQAPKPYWSQWGQWSDSCSVTCGIGVRRRRRTCLVPQVAKKVAKVLTVRTNKRCPGKVASQARNCDTHLTCPIHGGWSSWEVWECTATCAGGIGKRRRSCTNPKPLFSGRNCNGPSGDIGTCNEQPCPDQIHTLPPATARLVADQVYGVHQDLHRKQGAELLIQCRGDVISSIYRHYPTARVYWTKNGETVTTDNSRVKMSNYDLFIKSLDAGDNGVYVCHVDYGPGVDKPVAIAAVTVWGPKPNLFVHEGDNFNLTCHGKDLSVAYKALTMKWYHNNALYMDFANVSVSAWNTYTVGPASVNMSGVWSCHVTDRVFGKSWITNVVRLEVLPPLPSRRSILSNKNVWMVAAISACLLVLIVCSYLSYAISKAREESRAAFETWCQVAEGQRKSNGTFRSWHPSGEHRKLLEDYPSERFSERLI